MVAAKAGFVCYKRTLYSCLIERLWRCLHQFPHRKLCEWSISHWWHLLSQVLVQNFSNFLTIFASECKLMPISTAWIKIMETLSVVGLQVARKIWLLILWLLLGFDIYIKIDFWFLASNLLIDRLYDIWHDYCFAEEWRFMTFYVYMSFCQVFCDKTAALLCWW